MRGYKESTLEVLKLDKEIAKLVAFVRAKSKNLFQIKYCGQNEFFVPEEPVEFAVAEDIFAQLKTIPTHEYLLYLREQENPDNLSFYA